MSDLAKISVHQDQITKLGANLTWTVDEQLPTWTLETFKKEAQHADLIMIDSYVLDVSKFKTMHPGGTRYLENYIGKDATPAFFGPLNNHTRSAKQKAKDLRVAMIK
jgi:stearoyl-CoA desaturase (delta-9 desaturase)